jgi:acyl-CoA reductase-like NAD-dependent aldehyde dehydrogenase
MTDFDPYAGLLFVDNEYQLSSSKHQHQVLNPADLKHEGTIALCDSEEVERVITCAKAAQAKWKQVDEKSRSRLLHQLANSIEGGEYEEVAKLMVLEMGKPYPEAVGELANCAPIFRYYAEMARDEGGVMPGTTQTGSFQFAKYFPYGVTAHIMPFNFPIIIMCWTVAASLAAGNACVVKPAESTTLCTLKFMEHFKVLPTGLVNCVTGGAEAGKALVNSANTHAVAFTGSVEVGRQIAVSCAEQMKPTVIEAGGSDPMIISEHAPLDVAVPGCVMSAFHLSGQICVSSERFFVHEAIHDEFVERFKSMAKELRIGPGLEASEIGPLVSKSARDKVMRLVEDAVSKGASVECGGQIPPQYDSGWYYEPTILTGVTAEMAVMQEEAFGPLASICKVSSIDEALEMANSTRFGLGASIFTSSMDEAMKAYETLEAGMVWVNNPLIDNDAIPFGGWKMSGMGREMGRQGLNAFRQTKMGVIDTNPEIQDWWYPYPQDWFYTGKGREV